MRIVFFTHRFLPDVGGVQLSVEATGLALAADGHDVHIITESKGPDRIGDMTVHRLQIPRLRPITRLLMWRSLLRLLSLFRSSDVLHFHDYGTYIHWFLPLRPFCRRPVYAMTFHGFDGWPITLRHHVWRDVAARMMDVTFAVGSYVRTLYAHRIDYCFLGAPLRAQAPSAPDALHILFVGRLADDTGVLPVLDALDRASRAKGVRTTVTLVGEASDGWGRDARSWQALALTQHPPTLDVDSFIAEASVIIATGLLALFDAFACRRCVLVPALTPVKREYVSSITEIDALALVARSDGELDAIARHVLEGGWKDEGKRIARARTFAEGHTWQGIAALHLEAYASAQTRRAA